MIELLKTIKVLGLRHMLKLKRAKHFGGDIIRGYFTTRAINTLFNIGLFDEFVEKGEVNIESFGAMKNLDTRILKLLCDYLYSLRILKKEGPSYSLDSNGKLLTEMLRGPFDLLYAYEDILHFLESLLKREKKYGEDVNRHAEFVAKGSGEATQLLLFPIVIDIINKSKFKKILDLGCGEGGFLISLCKHNSRITGYGVDISREVIVYAQKQVRKNNLDNRINLFIEDIFELERIANRLHNIDATTCFSVLHEYAFLGTEKVLMFLANFRKIFQNSPLIVCELTKQTAEELRRCQTPILEHHLFHGLSNQGLLSREEWKELFKKAGFSSIKEKYLDFAKIAIYTIC